MIDMCPLPFLPCMFGNVLVLCQSPVLYYDTHHSHINTSIDPGLQGALPPRVSGGLKRDSFVPKHRRDLKYPKYTFVYTLVTTNPK